MADLKEEVRLVRSKAGNAASIAELWDDLEGLFRDHTEELSDASLSLRLAVTDLNRSLALKLEEGRYSPLTEDAPADVTISAKDKDMLAFFSGKLNPAMAVLFGKIKVQGDLKALAPLSRFL